jgi:hypothetical protein
MQLFLFRIYGFLVDTSPLPHAGLPDASGKTTLVIDVFNVIFGVLAGIAFISVVYGGFKYVISRGEPDKIGKAKDIIMYSVIGLGISFCAFGIINLLLRVLG